MVDRDCRRPLGAVMAVSANVGRIDVRRVLAGGHGTVVTGAAFANHLGVVDGVGGRPVNIVMTVLAQVRRIQVGQRVLACCADAVMAAGAVVDDILVVEIGRQPARGRMAVVARVAGLDVIGVLARGGGSVVTGAAGTNDLKVVDRVRRCPFDVVVAVFAQLRCRDVCRGFPCSSKAVMAAGAIAGYVDVVEIGRHPGSRRVAVVAVVAAADMRLVLAGCDRAVMAAAARADDLRVVDGECGYPA